MIAERIDNLIGILLIATPATLADGGFQTNLRKRLQEIKGEVHALEVASRSLASAYADSLAIPPIGGAG